MCISPPALCTKAKVAKGGGGGYLQDTMVKVLEKAVVIYCRQESFVYFFFAVLELQRVFYFPRHEMLIAIFHIL